MQQIKKKSLLVESDTGVLHLVRFVIRNGFLQLPTPLAEHRRHDFHELWGVPLISSLHHTNLSSTSSLPVPDVLSQQHCLQTREGRGGEGGSEEIQIFFAYESGYRLIQLPQNIWFKSLKTPTR